MPIRIDRPASRTSSQRWPTYLSFGTHVQSLTHKTGSGVSSKKVHLAVLFEEFIGHLEDRDHGVMVVSEAYDTGSPEMLGEEIACVAFAGASFGATPDRDYSPQRAACRRRCHMSTCSPPRTILNGLGVRHSLFRQNNRCKAPPRLGKDRV